MTDEERRQLIRDELALVSAAKDKAAADDPATHRYPNLCGREAALKWVLAIEEVTMIELVRRARG